MRASFFLIIILFAACNEQNSVKTNLNYGDSLKAQLLGRWGGLAEDGPVWDFRMDSIYYYDRSAAFPYTILNRDVVISLPEVKAIFKNIHVVKDTLFFLDAYGLKIKAYRFKK
ncbi:MAG: hypothetical protein M3004_02825 [Bacteroidota bacterium]|nr:hypothetical protein [Bacteroidota bacterium]